MQNLSEIKERQQCLGIRLCMASYDGISVDTVATVEVNIVEWYTHNIIPTDLRLVASQLYNNRVLPSARHVTYSRAVTANDWEPRGAATSASEGRKLQAAGLFSRH